MIRYIFLTGLFLVTAFCKGQNNDIKKILIHFDMFKHPNITYTIDYKNNEMTGVMLSNGDKGSVTFKKKYFFTTEQLIKFTDVIAKDIPDTLLEVSNQALDGGGFTITFFKANGKTSKLIVRNPQYEQEKFKEPLLKIEAFFNFAYSITKDPDSIDLLDESYNAYYSGLPVRKVSNNPLEYKIWGSISYDAAHNPGLINFLDSLPSQKCVIIDCNDNLSYALQEDILRLYIIKNSNLKFTNNGYLKYTRKNLLEMRELLRKPETDNSQLKRNIYYQLYLSDSVGLDRWLGLPEALWNISLSEVRKKCN